MRRLAMATVALFVLAHPVRADEEKVPLDKVPKAVLEAAKKRFPKAEAVGASKEAENGKTVYEVELKEGGKTIDVTLTPEGTITVIEKQIDAKDLPKAVAETLDKQYPKATVKIFEEVTAVKEGKEVIDFYEALLVTADKKEIEVQIAVDGKVKKVEEKKPEKKEQK
ncbi:MAG: PepSY-like domain-containing protein [Planctomycetes bacterium]|nr:PepSY-like domain-containing protein [Planctomycetota bacterium]